MLNGIIISDNLDNYFHYNEFSNLKKMVYLLQQTLLCDYVTMFSGVLYQPSVIGDTPNNTYKSVAPFILRLYRQQLEKQAAIIPKDSFNTGKYIHISKLLMDTLLGKLPSADDLMDVFYSTEFSNDVDISLPKEFLLPFVYAINGTYVDSDILPMNAHVLNTVNTKGYEFMNPLVYVPVFIVDDKYGIVLKLQTDPTYTFSSFYMQDYSTMRKNLLPAYRYLSSLNWSGRQFLHIVGFLQNFSIEHDPHLMLDDHVCTIGDICYDIVTGHKFCDSCKPYDPNQFISFIKHICEQWKIVITDCDYLGELLKRCGVVGDDVINYLLKQENELTDNEVRAFKESILFNIVKKSSIAIEANNSIDVDEDTDDTSTDDDQSSDDTDMSSDTDDISDNIDDNSEDDKKEDPPVETKPISVKSVDGVILELLNPENEVLSDFLFRKEFLIKVNELLKNPTRSKYSSHTLFMLKEWATKWLYIFSVTSLKSFLRNLHISLRPKQ